MIMRGDLRGIVRRTLPNRHAPRLAWNLPMVPATNARAVSLSAQIPIPWSSWQRLERDIFRGTWP